MSGISGATEARLDDQRIAERRIIFGDLDRALRALALPAPVAVLGTARSARLVAADAPNPKYQSFLASDLILAASILLRLGRTAEARALLEEAIPIQSGAVN